MSLVDDLKPSEGQQNGFVSVVSVELRRGTERERERERERELGNLPGMPTSIPAPSPEAGSHPQPPR